MAVRRPPTLRGAPTSMRRVWRELHQTRTRLVCDPREQGEGRRSLSLVTRPLTPTERDFDVLHQHGIGGNPTIQVSTYTVAHHLGRPAVVVPVLDAIAGEGPSVRFVAVEIVQNDDTTVVVRVASVNLPSGATP